MLDRLKVGYGICETPADFENAQLKWSNLGLGIVWVLSIPVPTRYFSNGSGAKTALEPVLKITKPHTLACMHGLSFTLSRKSADTELNGNGVC